MLIVRGLSGVGGVSSRFLANCAHLFKGLSGVGGGEQSPGGGFSYHLPLISNSGAGETEFLKQIKFYFFQIILKYFFNMRDAVSKWQNQATC